MSFAAKLRRAPGRVATGAFILEQGLGKLQADDETAKHLHDAATSAGYDSNGGPGERPRYHPGYYAAFVLDPDHNNIELVNHHREP